MPHRSTSTRLFTVATLLATAIFCVAASPAQESDPLVGKWNMISTSDHEISWTLTIRYEEGKYQAVAATDDGEGPIKELKVEGRNLTFTVPYQGQDYEIKLKLVKDKLSGTWSGNGDSGDTTGTKAAAPQSR
ncbi:MAG: hypothetical protein WB992_07555 [Bryobacteraceae bacterium]